MEAAQELNFDEVERNDRRFDRNQRRRFLMGYRRFLRTQCNPLLFNDSYFKKYYRMSIELAERLIYLLYDDVAALSNVRVPVYQQILMVIRFLAEGSFQKGVTQDFCHPVSQPTFSRILDAVLQAIERQAPLFIRLPRTEGEREQLKERFAEMTRVDGVIALIDCFVVKIVRPAENEEAFFHHKYQHALNVQVVSDADFVIQSIRICPGSNNDRYIWRYSDAKQFFLGLRYDDGIEDREGHYYIFGDSGYTPSDIMLTPIRNAVPNSPEAQYTNEQVTTRCRVERLFGRLSNKWLAISRRRVLHYAPNKAARIVLSCAVLHNFIMMNGEVPHPVGEEFLGHNEMVLEEGNYRIGIAERERLINDYFIDV